MNAATPASYVSDPLWFPYRYDEVNNGFRFRRLSRADHAGATFLTDEYLGSGAEVAVRSADVAAAISAAPTAAPLHFIFHSAFCCSTLLARAFDLPGTAMGLKEPMLFNDIAGWQMRGATGPAMAAALGAGLNLLARPFEPGEAVIVKPSNLANALIAGTLQLQPQSRALLLYAPLPVYLGSIVRKGLDGRLWVRNLLVKQLQQGLHNLGFGVDDYLGQTDLQVAAMGWLAQQALFARLIARYPGRLLGLDSEVLMARPEAALDALGRHFGVTLDVAAIAAGPAFNRHSKSGAAFDASARAAETAAEAVHADEIHKTLVWAEAVARSQGVPMDLPAQLIG
jgi:hypothetical protein